MHRALVAAFIVAFFVPAAASPSAAASPFAPVVTAARAAAASPSAPVLSAAAAASYDVVGERFVRQINADTPLPPASLVKMLVALIVAEQLTPDEPVVISERAAATKPDNIRWPKGAVYTADQLLHGMMMESSNGAAVAFADHIAGSVPTFTTIMDERATSLGATKTHIVDPSGLDAPGQVSTAHDLALIAAAVLRDPWLSKIARKRQHTIPWPGGTYTLHTLNGWIVRYDGAMGVKNGYTTLAGNCLAAAAERSGRTVVTVVLSDRRWYADSAALMNDAFPRSVAGVVRPAQRTAVAAGGMTATATPGQRQGPSPWTATWMALTAAAMTVVTRRRQVVRRRAARRRHGTTAGLPDLPWRTGPDA